jgi:pilus assembly protein Flp/PilA
MVRTGFGTAIALLLCVAWLRNGRVTSSRKHTTERVKTRRRAQMDFITRLRAFVRDDEGQDLIEYALLVALISLVAVAAITTAGSAVNNIFASISTKLTSAL